MPVARPARNMLFIMSDEHNQRVMGCAGSSDDPDAEHGPLGRERRAVYRRLLQLADLRALAR